MKYPCSSSTFALQRKGPQSNNTVWRQKHKHYTTAGINVNGSITRLAAADRHWEWIWRMAIRVIGEHLEVVRGTVGGVLERLRWARSSPERGAGSPEARNTQTLTQFTASLSWTVPWFLSPSFPLTLYFAEAAPAFSKLLSCLFLSYSYEINSSLFPPLDSNQLSTLYGYAHTYT